MRLPTAWTNCGAVEQARAVREAVTGNAAERAVLALRQPLAQARGEFTAMLDALVEVYQGELRVAAGNAGQARRARRALAAIDLVLATREQAQGNVNPRLALGALAVAACLHLGLVFLHVAPSNTVGERHRKAVDGWIYPEFEQNWKLFAPNPLQQNIAVEVRAQVRTADGKRITTGWRDLSAEDGAAIRANPFPSHAQQNELRRAWDFFTGSHDEENRPQGERDPERRNSPERRGRRNRSDSHVARRVGRRRGLAAKTECRQVE